MPIYRKPDYDSWLMSGAGGPDDDLDDGEEPTVFDEPEPEVTPGDDSFCDLGLCCWDGCAKPAKHTATGAKLPNGNGHPAEGNYCGYHVLLIRFEAATMGTR